MNDHITFEHAKAAVDELGREYGMRRSVYPKLVEAGTITQVAADRQNAGLRMALKICRERMEALDPQTALFDEAAPV